MKRFLSISVITVIMAIILPFNGIAQQDSSTNYPDELSTSMTQLIQMVDSLNNANTELIRDKYSNENDTDSARVEVVAIVFGTVVGALIIILPVFFICYFVYRKRTIRYRVIEKALDHNISLPESFFNEVEIPTRKSRLQSALVWIAWGVGLMPLLYVAGDNEGEITIGFIPLFVGIAKLITYFIEDYKKAKNNAE